MVDDVVARCAFGQIVDGRNVQQHFEIEVPDRISERAAPALARSRFTVIERSPRNSRMLMTSSGKLCLKASAIGPLNVLIFFEESNK